MKYIIETIIHDDEGREVLIREEYATKWEFDRRYSHLTEVFDDPIKFRVEK